MGLLLGVSVTSLNSLTIVVGPAEYGKSTIVRGKVLQHLRSHERGVAFVHDPHGQFSDMCAPYKDAAAVRAALASPRFYRGFSVGGSSSDVRALALELGERWNKSDNVRVPILWANDESSLMDSSSKNHMSAEDLAVCSNRRHWGIAPVLNVQSVTNLTRGWYEQATEVYVLSQVSEDRARLLEEYLGLRRGAMASIMGAPKFQYLHWLRGVGLA